VHKCLFSSLYKTQAYLDEHLAIFHPAYVDKCLQEADIKKVAVGKYFMPPAEIQKGSLSSWLHPHPKIYYYCKPFYVIMT